MGLAFVICLLLTALSARGEWTRGVALEHQSFYVPGKDFTCLDGSATLPFEYVNDDYCDCADASDEPGTSACTNGHFHCANKGHKPHNLISSRVNDGICDCCDGSDEWVGNTDCPNTCVEMGRKAKEEFLRIREVQKQGYKKRQEYARQGDEKRREKEEELARLKTDQGVLEAEVESLKQAKDEATEPADKAKQEHKERWEKLMEEKKAEQREADARRCFNQLDANADGSVSQQELRGHAQLDDDGDGEVGEEEARQYLDGRETVSFEAFKENVWDIISDKCFPKKDPETPQGDGGGDESEGGEDKEEEDEDEEDEDEEDSKTETEEGMPDFDEDTKALIEKADKAKQELEEAESRKRDLDSKIGEIDHYLGMSLGTEHEFSPLFDQCYEFTDREYTYKLCVFKQITQRSKSGGRETSLGNWDSWEGSDFTVMKYTGGEKCWNGPNRSMTVKLVCGAEEQILSAGEPNRCEYAMEFASPAACKEPSSSGPYPHVEL